jgi:hypothetical protein
MLGPIRSVELTTRRIRRSSAVLDNRLARVEASRAPNSDLNALNDSFATGVLDPDVTDFGGALPRARTSARSGDAVRVRTFPGPAIAFIQ